MDFIAFGHRYFKLERTWTGEGQCFFLTFDVKAKETVSGVLNT